MILTFRYRLLPTKRQHRALESMLESQRQLYNAALEERIGAYRKAGLTLSYVDQCRGLTQWRQSDAQACSIPANLQRWTLKCLHCAYLGFFRRLKVGKKAGAPRFRGAGRFRTFGFNEFSGIRLKGSRLHFKGMPGNLRVHLHRTLPGDGRIRSCFFRKDEYGWSVGLDVEVAEAPPRQTVSAVGVDLGITTFAALSDGGFIPSLKAALRAEKRVRRAQRALARKQRGSAECAGSRVVEVNPHGTSQQCSACGANVPKTLGVRHHDCAHCGLSIDRDLNAARNILNRVGMGPGSRNVADEACVRAETSAPTARRETAYSSSTETLPLC